MFEGVQPHHTDESDRSPPPPVRRSSVSQPAASSLWESSHSRSLRFSGRVDLGALVTERESYVNQPHRRADEHELADIAAVAAVKDVIARANQAQVQAYTRNDPTLMRRPRPTPTTRSSSRRIREYRAAAPGRSSWYSLDWVDVTISGSTAQATTRDVAHHLHRWVRRREHRRNDYTLVLQSGAWKIFGGRAAHDADHNRARRLAGRDPAGHAGHGDEQLEPTGPAMPGRGTFHLGHRDLPCRRVGECERSRRYWVGSAASRGRRPHSGGNQAMVDTSGARTPRGRNAAAVLARLPSPSAPATRSPSRSRSRAETTGSSR